MTRLITSNENGRIYINKFEVEKLIYKFINKNFPKVKCYKVSYQEALMIIYIEEKDEITEKISDELIEMLILDLNNTYGIYIENIEIR